jgi:hypothetical protein
MTKVLRRYMRSVYVSECCTSPIVKRSFLPSPDLFSVYRILLLGCASEQCKNTRGAIGMIIMTATPDDLQFYRPALSCA